MYVKTFLKNYFCIKQKKSNNILNMIIREVFVCNLSLQNSNLYEKQMNISVDNSIVDYATPKYVFILENIKEVHRKNIV